MFLTLLFLPLILSIVMYFFGKFFGKGSFMLIASYTGLLAIYTFCILFYYNSGNIMKTWYLVLGSWIFSDNIYIKWGFIFDSLTLVMLLMILSIATFIQIYSMDYMKNDPQKLQFFIYLSLFTFFMVFFMTSDNFIQMFLGWEGVGLCSYFLINFWFTRMQSNKAAIKAMLLNRMGDLNLLFGILMMFYQFNSVNYSVIFNMIPYMYTQEIIVGNLSYNMLNCLTLFIFLGAMGKSAQLGLHTWLPDAMEGPTPVSALLHSATMVTAGIFLLIRISFLLEYSTTTLFFMTLMGALTAFFGSTIGLFQNDMKRIMAYSTCSQLGYMVFTCGISNYTLSFFHLCNHAFFKALLFLCSGTIIHSLLNEQDIRKMGGLKKLLPLTYMSMLIGIFSLMGFPFLSGFYSKDLILEMSYSQYTTLSVFTYFLGIISVFCTAFYSCSLIFLVFLTSFHGFRSTLMYFHITPMHIKLSYFFFIMPSIFFGFMTKSIFIGSGTTFFKTSIYNNPMTYCFMENEYIPHVFKLLPCKLMFYSIFLCFFILEIHHWCNSSCKLSYGGLYIYNFFNKKWYFDKLHNLYFMNWIFYYSYKMTYQKMDKGIFEFLGPFGLQLYLKMIKSFILNFQFNSMYMYLFFLFIFSFFIFFILKFLLMLQISLIMYIMIFFFLILTEFI